MVVYKFWSKMSGPSYMRVRVTWEGWFLFGLIPMYVRKVSEKGGI